MASNDSQIATSSPNAVRDRNERQVLQLVLGDTQITQAELVQRTGLSRATVSDIVAALDRNGLIRRTTTRTTASSGRPPRTISLDPDAGVALGLDIGRDHIRLVSSGLADIGQGIADVAFLEDPAFQVSEQPERSLREATNWIRGYMEDHSWDCLVGVGVSVAGPIDPDRGDLATPSVMTGWRGINIADELRNRLGRDVRVCVENDASLGALAERRLGAARGYRDVAYLKISHGIGLGLIVQGELFHGARGYAGELGHTAVPESNSPSEEGDAADGYRCEICGKRCLEASASPPALAKRLGVPYTSAGFAEIVERAKSEAEDGLNRQLLTAAARDIGGSLANLVGILNPELILIGGLYGDYAFEIGYDSLMRELRTASYAPLFESVVVRKAMRGRRGPAEGAVLRLLQKELATYLQHRLAAPPQAPLSTPMVPIGV